jgi:Cys-tRNA(Pro)/Cys-tRNA(Cys) deacylase
MTPAIDATRNAKVAHRVIGYSSDVERGYGLEAAQALGIDGERIYKTLLAKLDGARLVVALVPVTTELDLKALAAAAGAKRAVMAARHEAERVTGYVVGGISPLGQRRALPTFVDAGVAEYETVYVSAGRRGLELELAPADLIALCRATTAAIARR